MKENSKVVGRNSATVQSNGNITLEPATNKMVRGQGDVRWGSVAKGLSESALPPFNIGYVSKTVGSGYFSIDLPTQVSTANYNLVVAGVRNTSSIGIAQCYAYKNGDMWGITVKFATGTTASTTVTVHYMGVHKNFSTDVR